MSNPATTSGPPAATADRLLVVGASAGGVEALREFVAGLPADYPGSVLVVLHVPATGRSALPAILGRVATLPVQHAVDGETLMAGRVLVAVPDHHLIVLDGRIALSRGPQENGHRPAVDVLFRSAARAWGARVTAVVLSGSLDDGAAGAVAVADRGGVLLVQDPADALYGAMPAAAAAAVPGAPQLSVRELAERITEDARRAPVPVSSTESSATIPWIDTETLMADLDPDAMHDLDRPGRPSGFGCPDCAGSLFAIDEGPIQRFRCRVGHAWSPESLLERQGVALESALWMALRALEEKAALQAQLRERALEWGSSQTAERFGRGQEEATHAAELVRRLVAEVGDVGGGAGHEHGPAVGGVAP